MNIGEAIKNIDNVLNDMDNIVVGAIMENEAEIIDLNISQLSQGLGASGNKLPEYESDEYFFAKKAEGLTENAGRHYNILLDGGVREGMNISKTGGGLAEIDSTDDKTFRLETLTDVDIFGIAPKNRNELLTLIAPEIKRKVLNRIIK